MGLILFLLSLFFCLLITMTTLECDCGGKVYTCKTTDETFKTKYYCKCSVCHKVSKSFPTEAEAKKDWREHANF